MERYSSSDHIRLKSYLYDSYWFLCDKNGITRFEGDFNRYSSRKLDDSYDWSDVKSVQFSKAKYSFHNGTSLFCPVVKFFMVDGTVWSAYIENQVDVSTLSLLTDKIDTNSMIDFENADLKMSLPLKILIGVVLICIAMIILFIISYS